jgi:hypothetical protein
VYSRTGHPVVLVVYRATTTQEPAVTEEASEVRCFEPAELPWDGLAFWSTRDALEDFLRAP